MTDVASQLSTALADRYRLGERLGEGGMATVYLAEDLKHERKVALKVLRPELAAVIGAERFLQEIKVTANLQHPHILALHDSGEVEGTVFYVMPYVEGESLRDQLRREHQLPVGDAVRIASEVADALQYAHGHGVVHRDIKPENILMQGGHALVADFGIALAVSRSEGGTRMTETGMSLGTPHYMSPEQAMGDREISGKADVYALGCVLYEMLTGEPPFTGPTAQAIIARVMTEEPRSLTLQRRTVPAHVEAAVTTALSKLPADRFPDPAAFRQALHDPRYTGVTVAALATTPAAEGSGAQRRSPVTALLAAVTVVAVAFGAWGWLRAGREAAIPATWHHVTFGDSTQPTVDSPSLALSPDGNQLVFKGDGANGLLWVKRRGDLDPTAIPGTERAANPVFSPDGKWLAYVADVRLRKVSAEGGASVALADSVAGGYGGVAWLDDNTLVYVSSSLSELRRVNAAGGTGRLALQDSTLVGGGIGYPVPLPEARGVLFQYCSSGCVTMAVHVLDLRTGEQRQLLDDVAQASYLPIGRLLYVRRDGVAVTAPFDLERLEITGEAVPVVEDIAVRNLNGFAPLVWSPSGTLVYIRGSSGANTTTLVRVTRDGTMSPIDTAWYGTFNSLDLDQDGRRMAVGVGVGSGLNIWIKQLDRGPFTRLSFGNQDRRPAWSPDGRVVAFVRDSGNTSAVYGQPADGSGPDTLLARIDRQVQQVTWSPDGRWLILRTDNVTPGAGDLVGVRMDGGRDEVPLVASPFTELHPAVSPDGRWIAYASNESGLSEVYVRPFPDTDAARWQISNGGGVQPVWSPTGRELFFLNGGGTVLMVAEVQAGATFVAHTPVRLFSTSGLLIDGFHTSYAVAPDARSLTFLAPRRLVLSLANRAPQVVWVDGWLQELEHRLEP